MHRRAIVALLLFLFIVPVRANEVVRWNRVMTDASAAADTDPLTESRVFSIVHAAIHDALNAIDRRYESYRGAGVPASPNASPDAAIAAAAHAALVALMPERSPAFERALAETLERLDDRHAAFAGLEAGRRAAALLLAARGDDGASRKVVHPAGKKAGEYRPTPPDFTPAAFAQYAAVRPFVMTSVSQFRPARPLNPASARARAEMEEVRVIGGKESSLRNPEQSEIARYWYEHSTQGWNRVAREVAAARNLDAWESAACLRS